MKICFVAHFAYGALTGGRQGHVGGVEKQTSLMAKWLAGRGHEVSFLTWDEGQTETVTEIDGVKVIKMCRHDQGLPGARFLMPRWSSLIGAMRIADADLYYHNCAEYVTGQVALWCRARKKKFIFSVPSDTDCDPNLPTLKKIRERILYKYGLRKADKIIVQTETQQKMLDSGFGLPATVIPMPCPGTASREDVLNKPFENGNATLLWVGRISREKRLEAIIDVSSKIPHVHFDIVGGPDQDLAYAETVLEKARKRPNITVHGKVERDRMDYYYRNASALCCTSYYEGFPNTFLEAWNNGLPIISTVDPDDIIRKNRLGFAIEETDEIKDRIEQLIGDEKVWREYSLNARNYFERKHLVETTMPIFEQLFEKTIEEPEQKKTSRMA